MQRATLSKNIVAAFLVFTEFLEKDKSQTPNYATRNNGNRSKERSLSMGHFETNKCKVNTRKRLKSNQNSVPKLKPVNELRSLYKEERANHRHSCPTLSSYNEDIYVPEEDTNLNKWFTKLHNGRTRHSNDHFMSLINEGK